MPARSAGDSAEASKRNTGARSRCLIVTGSTVGLLDDNGAIRAGGGCVAARCSAPPQPVTAGASRTNPTERQRTTYDASAQPAVTTSK